MHVVGFIIRICHDARSPEREVFFLMSRNFGCRQNVWRLKCEPEKKSLLIEQGCVVAYLASREWKDTEEVAGWSK